jgi:hypothetical protein
MKTYGRMDVQIHVFFNSEIVGGEWSASGPVRFILGERVIDTHWILGLVGPIINLDDVEKRKMLPLLGLEL